MAAFSTSNQQAGTATMSAAFKSFVGLTAATATLTSAAITDFSIGIDGTPADNAQTWQAIRTTTSVGTGSSATPSPTDLSKRASGMVSTVNLSAEPTITAELWTMALNQRASFRWIANPGSELIVPATNLAGISVRGKSLTGYTGACTVQVAYNE